MNDVCCTDWQDRGTGPGDIPGLPRNGILHGSILLLPFGDSSETEATLIAYCTDSISDRVPGFSRGSVDRASEHTRFQESRSLIPDINISGLASPLVSKR